MLYVDDLKFLTEKDFASEDVFILELQGLASKIWHECYKGILTKAQIDYMLENFYSKESLLKALDEGYVLYIIKQQNISLGYIGLKIAKCDFVSEKSSACKKSVFIDKLYIKKEHRDKGVATKIIKSLASSFKIIWLYVNKNNINAIKFYEKFGFKNIYSTKKDIGEGYFMDDYVYVYES
ncbi:hypothetical protein BKH43_00965 [Helicobacter sp. 13S00401-1]|uniref:GNAT family N-acetyltransferase n=1 Tax=Helicobacter sp. 13S00401-1 TaxID=1905758 RepID=UPI000BA68759|nr:GNAT family N-acetyltransferase [Helicobacter sp. 13S00401-1]PAF51835.1 hypothetical protein BKH43_00965 [Helicobacter sp. 13S00401-1]